MYWGGEYVEFRTKNHTAGKTANADAKVFPKDFNSKEKEKEREK